MSLPMITGYHGFFGVVVLFHYVGAADPLNEYIFPVVQNSPNHKFEVLGINDLDNTVGTFGVRHFQMILLGQDTFGDNCQKVDFGCNSLQDFGRFKFDDKQEA
ncbi:hypothetical protein B0H17DRAFT_1128205 [Mycena rosella]|uniref:Uncharacterized protein n=1 Tax=Mycena rosella TaxID=1033263 RepID=A0AAD7GQZ0_MYCRO|nr:hypothetical protein B0H17DRAFT_1128205 [Mycena rosella]